jgi:hypothetical protein
MDLLMDGLLAAATLFAGGYCWVLARRVRELQALDKGLGGSIVTLTRQVELARGTLEEARGAAGESRHELGQLVGRAEAAAAQLRLLIAAVGEQASPAPPRPTPAEAPPAPPKLTLAFPEPAPAPARPAAAGSGEVPKPRPLPPLQGLLRKRTKGEAAEGSEHDLIEALSALVGER